MCDTLVVVRPGKVLFGKNSDRDPNEAQVLEWRPRERHPAGSLVRCTWVNVPQARETHAVFLSRPYWMWGAEMGLNEHGVVIGNEAVFTNQPYAKEGLTGMDLLRLALERGATAKEAVDVIVRLLEEHGQGGGCGHERRGFTYHNSFLVCDEGGAFVLETAGRKWQVERVDDGPRSISNGLSIAGFREAHADRLRAHVAACEVRRSLTTQGAGEAHTPADVMTVLRGHGAEPWPRYATLNGTLSMPCMHGGGLLAGSVTTSSMVVELSDGAAPRAFVTGTSAPCLSLYKPVRVDEPVDTGALPTDRDDGGASLWWAHERLHRLVMRDPARLAPLFVSERDALERRFLEDGLSSAAAFEEGRAALESWTAEVASASGADLRPWLARRYWRKREARAAAPARA